MTATIQIDSASTHLQSRKTQDTRQSTFPADLREWLDTSELIGLVLEAVHTLYWTSHEEKEAGVESNHPQLILGLLAYSYATGRYSADEITRQTTTEAISMGLPSRSLTLSFSLLKLRMRSDTFRLTVKGFTHQKPVSREVPA